MSEQEYQNQSQVHSESAGMLALLCPLEPSTFITALRSTGLRVLEEIEKHVSTSQCHHPPLKDLVLHGPLDGTTPLLLACYYDLDCVKHLVENWHADFQAAAVYYCSPSSNYCGKIGVATPLYVAARYQHFGIVQYLVGKGADVNGKGTRLEDVEGPTSLQRVLRHTYDPKIRANVKAIALLLLKSRSRSKCQKWMARLDLLCMWLRNNHCTGSARLEIGSAHFQWRHNSAPSCKKTIDISEPPKILA